MPLQEQQTLFALDCGATNWRLYRSIYQFENGKAILSAEPQISSLTSFTDRKLPAVILLSPDEGLESFGENARLALENEGARKRVREFFKPCIGGNLYDFPHTHRQQYSHEQALNFTALMLKAVFDQVKREKWRAGAFDSRVWLTIAFPVHWRTDHEGSVFQDFREMVLSCFPEGIHNQIRFVAEPEGAILALHRGGHLHELDDNSITLIADIGGSTTDIVAGYAKSQQGALTSLGRYGEPFGGGAYDQAIASAIAEQLDLPDQVMEQPYIISTLRSFARRLKESLSRQHLSGAKYASPPQRMISIVDEHNQIYRKLIQLDESLFTEITRELQVRFKNILENAISQIGINQSDVGQVVLVGGGAQLFSIVNHLRELFGEHKVLLADNPEEIVVQGIGLEYGKSFEDYQPTFYFRPDKQIDAIEKPGKEKRLLLVGENESFTMIPGKVYRVGRDRENTIQLNSDKISRFHALIEVTQAGCLLQDNGSTNGSFVNDQRLDQHASLPFSEGDQIRFGDLEFQLMIEH